MIQSGVTIPVLSQSQRTTDQIDQVLDLGDPCAGGDDGHPGQARHQWPDIDTGRPDVMM